MTAIGDLASAPTPAQAGPAAALLRDGTQSNALPATRSTFTSPPANPGDADTFAALDRTTAGPQTTWIHAGAHHAEAGYLDPSFGWVTVRADATAAGMHAALVPASPEAASALSNHLAGLNAFLADHHGHTATITLALPEAANARSGDAQFDSAANGRRGQQPQQQPDQAAPEARNSNATSLPWKPDPAASRLAVPQSPGGVPAPNGNGVYLSVMA